MTTTVSEPVTLPLPTPCVVALMGASGAGKSTLARQLAQHTDVAAISYDRCREELVGDPHEQSATAAAVKLAHSRVHARCRAGLTTIVDATHTTRGERRRVLDVAAAYAMSAVVIAVATPLHECLARQLARPPRRPGGPPQSWRVPDDVVRTQHAALLASLPHLHTEGWHSVHILHTHHLTRPAERTV